ncbi:effector-associated constant component EACC1 [Herbidospora galbida]|uniref:effector-associated constant component EACC1 n=1 Tax=Herbidospora galbida TaxID=2575442 RepID=UPI003CCC7248
MVGMATITVLVPVDGAGGDAHSLRAWLAAEEELGGHVRTEEPAVSSGYLGSLVEVLTLVLAPGGALTILSATVITWIRHRTGNTRITIQRDDGAKIDISAQRVRSLDATVLSSLTSELNKWLAGSPERPSAVEQGDDTTG